MLVDFVNQWRDASVAAKSALNGPWKVFDEKTKSSLNKFVSVMANVFHIRETAVKVLRSLKVQW